MYVGQYNSLYVHTYNVTAMCSQSFLPITQVMYPIGFVCISCPLSKFQALLSAPHSLINAKTSSGLLVLKLDIQPSKTTTKGMIGIMYVKIKCPGDRQKQNGVIKNISIPRQKIVRNEDAVRSWSSKILHQLVVGYF